MDDERTIKLIKVLMTFYIWFLFLGVAYFSKEWDIHKFFFALLANFWGFFCLDLRRIKHRFNGNREKDLRRLKNRFDKASSLKPPNDSKD